MDTSGTVELLLSNGSVGSVWKWSDLTALSQVRARKILEARNADFADLTSDELYEIIDDTRARNGGWRGGTTGRWTWNGRR